MIILLLRVIEIKISCFYLQKKIREKHKTVYCFIESDASIKNVGKLDMDAQEAMKQFESLPDWKSHMKVFEVFLADMEALRNSNTLILLLPAEKSAHIEAGVAYGLGKN